jgi:hypothetical protein
MSKYNFEMVFILFEKDSCTLGNENFNFGLIMNHSIKMLSSQYSLDGLNFL